MIFPNYGYKEFNNSNKSEWTLQPPTQENWNNMIQDAYNYCEDLVDVSEFADKCEVSDLPSFHPYWRNVTKANSEKMSISLRKPRGDKSEAPTEEFPTLETDMSYERAITIDMIVKTFGNLCTSCNILYKNIEGKVVGKRSVYTYNWEVCWLEDTRPEEVKSWWCGGKNADYTEIFETI